MNDRLAVIVCAYGSGALTILGIAAKRFSVLGLPANLAIFGLAIISLVLAIWNSTEKDK